jgi:hypothetical protein
MTPSEILEYKLQTIENQFNTTDTVAATEAFMEERIHKIQQDHEVRLKDEVDEQLKRLKDVEIAQMRLEERKKFQSDLLKAELEYERKDSERRRRIEEWEEKEKSRLERKEKVSYFCFTYLKTLNLSNANSKFDSIKPGP